MNVKRIVSGLVLFPVAAAILILRNKYVVDVAVAILAIMCLHEFYKAFRTGQKANQWGKVLSGVLPERGQEQRRTDWGGRPAGDYGENKA